MSQTAKHNFQPFAPLLIRLSVGFYFFLLGLWAYLEPDLSTQAINRYSGFSGWMTAFYVNFGCYLFFVLGILLIFGCLTKHAALLGSLLLLPLLYGAGIFTPHGDNLVYFLEKRSLYRDGVIFASCLSLVFSGGGAVALDGLLLGLKGDLNR